MTKVKGRVRAIAWLLSLVYFASYVMRINLSVVTVKVYSDLGVGKESFAIVLTALTITYGIGQILCGFLGDKIKPKIMISCGVFLASACNIAMFFADSIPVMTVLWGINGLAHAMFWPPIVRLMAENLSEAEYAFASVRVTWGSSIATIVLYLLCPLLLFVVSWRIIMLICAIVGALIGVIWLILSSKLFDNKKEPKLDTLPPKKEKTKGLKPPIFAIIPLMLIMIGIIMQGALRDGVTSWMPSYLLDSFGMPEELSILTTVVLAVFSMVSFTVFDLINRHIFKDEVACACAIFGIATLSAIVLYIVSTFTSIALLSVIFMSLLVACMHGTNLMLIAIAPKRFKRTGKVSTYSGIMNACTYVGAAISTYGFAALSSWLGWGVTILVWIGVALVGAIVCLIAIPLWKKFRREFDEIEK